MKMVVVNGVRYRPDDPKLKQAQAAADKQRQPARDKGKRPAKKKAAPEPAPETEPDDSES